MKKLTLILTIILLVGIMVGCSQYKETFENITGINKEESKIVTENYEKIEPGAKPNGEKYKIAYIDYDPYENASRLLYNVIEALKNDGWIEYERLPFSETYDAKKMIDTLSKMDIGNYIEFNGKTNYYMVDYEDDYIATNLRKHVEIDKDVDLIIANGTGAGEYIEQMNLEIPCFVIGTTDPVKSEIIKVIKGENNEMYSKSNYMWAHIEPSVPRRQLKYYHDLIEYKKLGIIIYGDETISATSEIYDVAKELGVEVVKINTNVSKEDNENRLKEIDEIIDNDIDAFLITPNLFEMQYLSDYCNKFYNKNIPVFAMESEDFVENGAIMGIVCNDFYETAKFIANNIEKYLSGSKLTELPLVYASSPVIYFNVNSANKIGYRPSYEFLTSCDKIYGGGENE